MTYPHFVIVIHPAAIRRDAIFNALSNQSAVALNVMTYAEWLDQGIHQTHDLLYILNADSWRSVKGLEDKLAIRELLLKAARRSGRQSMSPMQQEHDHADPR